MPDQLKALAEGRVDVIQVFEPFVAQAEAASLGQVLYAAHQRGEVAGRVGHRLQAAFHAAFFRSAANASIAAATFVNVPNPGFGIFSRAN